MANLIWTGERLIWMASGNDLFLINNWRANWWLLESLPSWKTLAEVFSSIAAENAMKNASIKKLFPSPRMLAKSIDYFQLVCGSEGEPSPADRRLFWWHWKYDLPAIAGSGSKKLNPITDTIKSLSIWFIQ